MFDSPEKNNKAEIRQVDAFKEVLLSMVKTQWADWEDWRSDVYSMNQVRLFKPDLAMVEAYNAPTDTIT